MNTLLNNLSVKKTENGAVAKKTTGSKVYDMFALGAAYRSRSDSDCTLLFAEAYKENPTLALKCLFWIRDVRGGAGERRFFRICYKWLVKNHLAVAKKFMEFIPEYGRWDDLIEIAMGTKLEDHMIDILRPQLREDIQSETPSLLAKWIPSITTSSSETKAKARKIAHKLGFTSKQYRVMLSSIRKKINIVERLMSENKWSEIQYGKLPSKAGLQYRHAFTRNDEERYTSFIKSKDTTVHAAALFPYDIVKKVTASRYRTISDIEIETLEKFWKNQPDYLEGKPCKMMCVVDTSGSMTWGYGNESGIAPIDVAISLGMYCAERIGGDFKNHYISFSSQPQLIAIKGKNFVDKVRRIYDTNLCDNTDLIATFELLREASLKAKPEDRLDTIVVISDMEIDGATRHGSKDFVTTEMQRERQRWQKNGLKMPRLVYWNVNARHDTILDADENVSFVSGASPILFKQIVTGKTGMDIMYDTLYAERYDLIGGKMYHF